MNKSLSLKTNEDWEELAQLDAMWSILTSPEKKYGRWRTEEFLKVGEEEVGQVIEYLNSKNVNPDFEKILDFGCGIGRLAISFSKYSKFYYGADISPTMLKLARQFNQGCKNCKFLLNEKNNLSLFKDNFFDFIYSNLVLQHILPRDSKQYISEFIRILKPSGYLYFQLPGHIPLIHRIQPSRHLYKILKKLGFSPKFLWRWLKLTPIRMAYVPTSTVLKLIGKKVRVLDIQAKDSYETKYLIQKL